MGFEELAVGALGGFGLLDGVLSSNKKNKAARRMADSAKASAAVQSQQEIDRAAQESRRQIAEQRRVRAAVLASSAGSGFDVTSQDIDSILTGYRVTTQDATDTIEKNLNAGLALIDSQLQASLASANAQKQDSLFSGFSGAISGVTSGLTLLNAADALSKPEDPKVPPEQRNEPA